MSGFLRQAISRLDFAVWILVCLFFCGSALLLGGNVQMALLGAGGIIVEMLFISLAIEVIIESLKNTKGIGTITGFITNGPEALCLLVGLWVGDIIFAASTPLGSNFMNPVLLLIAALICRQTLVVLRTRTVYTLLTISLTALVAASFFALSSEHYPYWLAVTMLTSLPLFYYRPEEPEVTEAQDYPFNPRVWLMPAILMLVTAGYLLDPVVSFTATHSHAPKGVIGFFVLATLTSWPEFKSCLVLLKRGKPLAAILNITVSNLTNLWLAAIGAATYLIL